mmetsp:Transcript_4394/g.13845  ORF Transcript_4394/g.13845 Transcript_4394/m.13845 type:complete len:202 (+) Transcript_4394:700-1305(+)
MAACAADNSHAAACRRRMALRPSASLAASDAVHSYASTARRAMANATVKSPCAAAASASASLTAATTSSTAAPGAASSARSVCWRTAKDSEERCSARHLLAARSARRVSTTTSAGSPRSRGSSASAQDCSASSHALCGEEARSWARTDRSRSCSFLFSSGAAVAAREKAPAASACFPSSCCARARCASEWTRRGCVDCCFS